MITDVDYFSLEEARGMRPRADTLLISILDRSEAERMKRPRLDGWRSVLVLEFEDSHEEAKLAPAGSWPDSPTPEQHVLYTHTRQERIPTLDDAERLIEFIAGHQATDAPLHLVVHCKAGVSRSAAVAKWVEERLGVPRSDSEFKATLYANPRVLRLMDKAWAAYNDRLNDELGEGTAPPGPSTVSLPATNRPRP